MLKSLTERSWTLQRLTFPYTLRAHHFTHSPCLSLWSSVFYLYGCGNNLKTVIAPTNQFGVRLRSQMMPLMEMMGVSLIIGPLKSLEGTSEPPRPSLPSVGFLIPASLPPTALICLAGSRGGSGRERKKSSLLGETGVWFLFPQQICTTRCRLHVAIAVGAKW